MNRIPVLILYFVLLFLSELYSKNKGAPYTDFCAKGETCLSEGKNDSAFTYFLLARTRGLPYDSLYYFLGETYRTKGVYDSALVLNYAIKHHDKGPFHLNILKQRYRIYAGLGWKELATDVLDTIKSLKHYRRVTAIPSIDVSMSTGYVQNNYRYNQTIPWNTLDEEFRNDKNGIQYTTDAVLHWDFPALPKNHIATGAGFHVDKPYWTGHTLNDIDSVSIAGNVFFGLNNIFEHLSWLYDVKYKQYYNSSSVFSQFTSLSFNWYNTSVLWFLTGAYSIDLDNEYAVDNHTFYLLSYNDFFMQKKWGLNVLLSVTGYIDNTFSMAYYQQPTYIYFVSMNGADVEYYTDDTFTELVDTTNVTWIGLSRALLNSRDSLYIQRTLPQKYFRYATTLTYTQSFGKTLSGRLGIQWNLAHYPEPYTWTSLDGATADSLNRGKLLALNVTDRSLYYIDETPRVAGLGSKDIIETISSQTASITSHRARRIDNTWTITMAIEKKFARMGSLELVGSGYKTWSSLGDDAPVDIPSWGGSVLLQWKKGINFTQG